MSDRDMNFKNPPPGFQLRFLENPHMERGVGVVMVHPDDYAMIRGAVERDAPTVTERMMKSLDEMQLQWSMLSPAMREDIDRRIKELVRDRRITKKPPKP